MSAGEAFESLNGKLADFEMTSRFEKRPRAVMTSSVIPSLKKSWPVSADRFLNGTTATEGRPASRVGAARVATSTRLGRGAQTEQVSSANRVKGPRNEACQHDCSNPRSGGQ